MLSSKACSDSFEFRFKSRHRFGSRFSKDVRRKEATKEALGPIRIVFFHLRLLVLDECIELIQLATLSPFGERRQPLTGLPYLPF